MSTMPNGTFPFDQASAYNQALTVADANGETNRASTSIQINVTLEGTPWALNRTVPKMMITLPQRRGRGMTFRSVRSHQRSRYVMRP